MLQAAMLLRDAPVEFHVVGPVEVIIPRRFREHPKLHWHGSVPRGAVAEHYQKADILLFPTFCDGFGLTQLEAQAWKLPVIASKFCGEVVKDRVNGIVLGEVSGEAIASAITDLVGAPETLRLLAQASGVDRRFQIEAIATGLLTM